MTTKQLQARLQRLEDTQRAVVNTPLQYWTDEELAQLIRRAHERAKSKGLYHPLQLTDEELQSVIDGAQP